MKLTSAVMFVTELDRSVTFYERLLAVTATVQTGEAALLVTADGDQLYLRAIGDRAQHPLGAVGIQYLIWTANDRGELDRCETLLREQSARVTRADVDDIALLEGPGPDGVPIMISYPGPTATPREEIIERIYAW
ncbi:hypothetical protein HQQ80_17065 [Microbacteriaceae bacterium VKM Ac-2855]|nr:hypothetical protein [Microbacteriaceae bacterium VKM Ac-2855]